MVFISGSVFTGSYHSYHCYHCYHCYFCYHRYHRYHCITTIIPGGCLLLPPPLPAQKSSPPTALPHPRPATIGHWWQRAASRGDEPPQDQELHPKIRTLACPCSGGHYNRVENAGNVHMTSKHPVEKDNFDNSLLKGDSRQGLHLTDPSSFSRYDCHIGTAAFHTNFPTNDDNLALTKT